MRFLHIALAASLVLTTKASDDPTHYESVSENPTGRAAVHGHPKEAAGSSGYRHAPLPYPYKPPKYNSEPHYHDTYEDSNDLPDYYKDDYHSSEKDDYHHGVGGYKAPVQDLVSLHTLKDVLADLLEDFLYEVKSYKCPKYVPEDKCDPDKWAKCTCISPAEFTDEGRGNCNLGAIKSDKQVWCYVEDKFGDPTKICPDAKHSNSKPGYYWSRFACIT